MYSGDVNLDGIVDISDMVIIDNDSFTFLTGYRASDVNGDHIVDISDMVIVDNSSFRFASVKKPSIPSEKRETQTGIGSKAIENKESNTNFQ